MYDGTLVKSDDPKWRFVVSLHVSGHYYCTASAINDYFALTAAHCLHEPVWEIKLTSIPGYLNYLNLNQITDPNLQNYIHNAIAKIQNDGYVPYDVNDIGLVKVDRQFTETMRITYVWNSADTPMGTRCFYASFGEWLPDIRENSRGLRVKDTYTHTFEAYTNQLFTKDDEFHTKVTPVRAITYCVRYIND